MSPKRTIFPLLALLVASSAIAQVTSPVEGAMVFPSASTSSWFDAPSAAPDFPDVSQQADAAQMLRSFRDSDIKFNLSDLTQILRDHQHEGWVLAAYPDPNTRRPLIGAGFSLDVPARVHPQTDPSNPHPFIEPSAADLWQAAGLEPERLQQILEEFNHNMDNWSARTYRHKIVRQTLSPQLTEEEGERLLRISAIQAIYNARAYCRTFDQLSGPQQMALSQLVFQMGVNLQQFVSFLGVLNDPGGMRELPQLDGFVESGPQHWKSVQDALMDSQWARRYSVRAASVIAMFDPAYSSEPMIAQQRVAAQLHPAVDVHRKVRSKATLRLASYHKRPQKGRARKASSLQARRKLT